MSLRKETGFSMIEVLVTMVIMSIGLLGLASLQTNSLKYNNSSYFRSEATLLAYDIADKIGSNNVEAQKTTFNSVDTSNSYTITDSCYSSAGCTTAQMADSDIGKWKEQLEQVLPSGKGVISKSGDLFSINISWIDIAANDQTNDTSRTKTLITNFRP